MTGHSAHDAAHYVPKEMFEEWGKLDPIVRLEKRMIQEGWAKQNDLDAVQSAVKAEVDDAVEWADHSPWPEAASLLQNVYENE
jgi:pyruvate dehydrogenase E1 component alpha subunit